MQLRATNRLELFGNLLWTRGTAAIHGLDYDPGALEPLLAGLDYRLMSSTFSGFSNLDLRQFERSVGANYRLSDDLILQGVFEWNRYDDRDPYLFNATGRYVSFVAGLNWVF